MTFRMLSLLLDNNMSLNSRQVMPIVAIKLTLLEQAKKRGFQLDTAQAVDELTAFFSACFY